MKHNFDYLGTDLAVAPFLQAHDAAAIDLSIATQAVRAKAINSGQVSSDYTLIAGRENLAHALLLRLLTPRGSLAELGHSEYGSRLYELIGRNKTSALRDLCRAFVLEVVAQEPRIEDKAVELNFDPLAETAESFAFSLAVRPIAEDDPLILELEVAI